jgi:hypothetical protein
MKPGTLKFVSVVIEYWIDRCEREGIDLDAFYRALRQAQKRRFQVPLVEVLWEAYCNVKAPWN